MKSYSLKDMNRSDEMIALMDKLSKIVRIGKSMTTSEFLSRIVIEPNLSPDAHAGEPVEIYAEWDAIVGYRTIEYSDINSMMKDLTLDLQMYFEKYCKTFDLHCINLYSFNDDYGIIANGFKKENKTQIANRIALSELQDDIQRVIVPEIEAYVKSKNIKNDKAEYEKELAKLKKKYNQ